MPSEINIKIQDFEGPLDLLLHLVRQYKMDVFKVPLVPVIEQYLTYVRAMQEMELELAGDYMLMASQLMLIKSRRLLPTVTEEFIEDTDQLEQDLLSQIEEYRKFKQLSEELLLLHDERSKYYSSSRIELIDEEVQLIKDKSSIDIYLAFSRVLEQRKQTLTDNNTTIESEKFSIADKIQEIHLKFKKKQTCLFKELFEKSYSKDELVTTFLAVLELIKSQELSFSQPDTFGEISLERLVA